MRILLAVIMIIPFAAAGQIDSLLQPPEATQQLIEDFLQNTDSEGEFDYNTIFENLEYYLERPLNVNEASQEELESLGLLSDIQVLGLLNYRQVAGDLISIYELQAIPSFDLLTIRRILPYVSVGGGIDDYQLPI